MMKKATFTLVVIGTLLIFSGCPNNKNNWEWVGRFPEEATNFADVNSPYDDYNAALPETHLGYDLIFSSNRNSQGQNFDIVQNNMHIAWYMEEGSLIIDDSEVYPPEYDYITPLLQIINSDGNEFGPLSFGFVGTTNTDENYYKKVITYSSDNSTNNFVSYLVYYQNNYSTDTLITVGPLEIKIINDYNNAQYLTLFGEKAFSINVYSFDPSMLSQLYFQAKNNGKTDIYAMDIPVNNDFIGFLTADTTYVAQKVAELSSSANDKCPYINAQTLVFTSDRPGGYGGYDLYYSQYENGQWNEAVNFGEKINSAYDEFRPVTLFAGGFETDLLIFSSDRPGGQGGFDIYYAALPFKVFNWSWMDI